MKYFVHTGEEIEFHETEESAIASAKKALGEWTAMASTEGGWPEEVESVCWGKIMQVAKAIPVDPGDFGEYEDCVDFVLEQQT